MPDAPIVLVHGILGFDQLKLRGFGAVDYFRKVPETLRQAGHVVPEPPTLNTAGSISERAQDLRNYLDTQAGVAGARVHIIAHSMGGLDTRFAISELGAAGKVISLTTIGTPHRGSPIADLLVKGTLPGTDEILDHLGVDINGVQDLTTTARTQQVADSDGVKYFSIAGAFEPPRWPGILGSPGLPQGLLGATHDIVSSQQGENDGVVSVTSAEFGAERKNWEFLGKWAGNHFRLINWGTNIIPTSNEESDQSILNNYVTLAARLQALP
ncbi:MAG TPA: alpha/beta fold hydrolase [Candidatus Angelobacter sp.]